MIVELAIDHLLRGANDGGAKFRVEMAQSHVGFGGCAFHDTQRPHDWKRLPFHADFEIAERTLGLRAPITVGRNFDGAERVGLGAGFCHGFPEWKRNTPPPLEHVFLIWKRLRRADFAARAEEGPRAEP